MSVRNGTATHGPSTDLLGSLGLRHPDLPDEPGEAPDPEFDARVRAVAERQRPSAPVTVRHVEPEAAATVPPRTAAGRGRAAAREDVQLASWRRDEIFEWLYADGPKTVAEIKEHFNLGQAIVTDDVRHLREEGRLERTGRERQGPRGGRPSAEFHAVVRDDTSHAQTGDAETEQPVDGPVGPEAPSGDAADAPPERSQEGTPEQDAAAVGREVAAPEPRLSLHEQLVFRYLNVLISSIERSTITRDQAPPEHVYDRIERLLQIEDGVA